MGERRGAGPDGGCTCQGRTARAPQVLNPGPREKNNLTSSVGVGRIHCIGSLGARTSGRRMGGGEQKKMKRSLESEEVRGLFMKKTMTRLAPRGVEDRVITASST